MLTILNLLTESGKYYSRWYGAIEKSTTADNVSFTDINGKKITLPVSFIVRKPARGNGIFWKRVKEGNEKQLNTLQELKETPSFIQQGFNDVTLKQIYDEEEYQYVGVSFKEFKKGFLFIEIMINELGHAVVRYVPDKEMLGHDDYTITFFKVKMNRKI